MLLNSEHTEASFSLVLGARPLYSSVFTSFRINAWREGLAHYPCAFGSMLHNISKHDAKEHDVIQIFAQRYQSKRHIRLALATVPSFLMAKTMGQLPKLLVMSQLFTG